MEAEDPVLEPRVLRAGREVDEAGGASGLGKAQALLLAQQGAKVVVPEDGRSPREQSAAGRRLLQQWTFADLEGQVRRLLDGALGGHGFDSARDLEAITVNRWSHGYALEYMRPWDQFWPDGPLPIETSRKPWGRVAIANSDAGAYAYVHSAIDQAARAVSELLGKPADMPAYSDFPGPPRDEINL